MPKNERYHRRYHADWHAHEAWEARDCDGQMAGGHTWWITAVPFDRLPDTPTADLGFEAMLLGSIASFDSEHPMDIELRADPAREDETVRHRIQWAQRTEEGYRRGETVLCDDPACADEDNDTWQRDYAAEAAGY